MPGLPYVRLARPADLPALSEVCLRTADAGQDATALYSDPDYPGLVWSAPYVEFEPAHCFVLDVDGVAAGFVVGAPDTLAYETRLDREWWPPLRRRYAGQQASAELDYRVLDFIASPKRSAAEILERYPAHLHINVLPRFQSGGWGRKLIEAELDSLRDAGAPAVHLGVSPVNHRAIGFYAHMGFEPIVGPGEGILLGKAL
ncbi:MAG TPA: GNAT family N-acetyltransferase [Devosiaceae bacterium]|nr:GNAT family N-acetyltransferase [Devosiaceae bacterium]